MSASGPSYRDTLNRIQNLTSGCSPSDPKKEASSPGCKSSITNKNTTFINLMQWNKSISDYVHTFFTTQDASSNALSIICFTRTGSDSKVCCLKLCKHLQPNSVNTHNIPKAGSSSIRQNCYKTYSFGATGCT